MNTIDNNTQEDYVDFENAKLLKEKGFDVPVNTLYNEKGTDYFKGSLPNSLTNYYSRPTIQLAVKWIYQNFKVHIEILLEEDSPWNRFYFRAMKTGNYFSLSHSDEYFDTQQEAYQTAIQYTLKNLI
jgi:hypothetical protein